VCTSLLSLSLSLLPLHLHSHSLRQLLRARRALPTSLWRQPEAPLSVLRI
jgi:hypothetical protein